MIVVRWTIDASTFFNDDVYIPYNDKYICNNCNERLLIHMIRFSTIYWMSIADRCCVIYIDANAHMLAWILLLVAHTNYTLTVYTSGIHIHEGIFLFSIHFNTESCYNSNTTSTLKKWKILKIEYLNAMLLCVCVCVPHSTFCWIAQYTILLNRIDRSRTIQLRKGMNEGQNFHRTKD